MYQILTTRSDETMMTIQVNADLRPIVKEQVGMLHWVMDPLVSGFIIAYDLSGNQVLICNFDVSSVFNGDSTLELTHLISPKNGQSNRGMKSTAARSSTLPSVRRPSTTFSVSVPGS